MSAVMQISGPVATIIKNFWFEISEKKPKFSSGYISIATEVMLIIIRKRAKNIQEAKLVKILRKFQ